MIEALARDGWPEWDGFVRAQPRSTIYHLSAWTALAEETFALPTRMLASRARHGGELRGVLPLFVVPRPLNRYVTTGIFGAYGRILATGDEARDELVRAAVRFTDEVSGRYLHIKSFGDEPCPAGLARQDVWTTAHLPLAGGADAVWRSFRSSIRAAVRQARRFGLTCDSGPGELGAFYDVLAENMHRKGAPTQGRRFFERLLAQFDGEADIITVRHEGRVIAGTVWLTYGDTAYVPFASARPASFPKRPNNLLFWSVIERACAARLACLDFGTSLRGASTLDFKLGWGARLVPTPSFLYVRDGSQARLDPFTLGIRAGVRFWRTLPRSVADRFGPSISRLMA